MVLTLMKSWFNAFYYRLFFSKVRDNYLKKAVLITGCDSGLGYNFAVHLNNKGVKVFAGVYNESSPGARSLLKQNISIYNVDVTDSKSVHQASLKIREDLNCNNYDYFGLINNAGIMVVGEFEWLTEDMIHQQVSVNLLGPMRVIKYFLPLLRQLQGRIINVSSHCAGFPLPGMAVYSASKAGLRAFSNGLQRELQKFGIQVIDIVPGSFIMRSNIMSDQKKHFSIMHDKMSDDVSNVYEGYFNNYTDYLSSLPVPDPSSSPQIIDDPSLYTKLEAALFSLSPKRIYINEPPRYFLYYSLFSILPDCSFKDYLVKKFIQMPEWNEDK